MTKREIKSRKEQWNQAVREGRVVRYANESGWAFRSFTMVHQALAFLSSVKAAGLVGNIVEAP